MLLIDLTDIRDDTETDSKGSQNQNCQMKTKA